MRYLNNDQTKCLQVKSSSFFETSTLFQKYEIALCTTDFKLNIKTPDGSGSQMPFVL